MPILDLRKAPNGGANFTYSVSAVVADGHRPTGELFESVESCLYDAGMALKNYFDGVQIRYDGIALGTYAVSRLVNDPLGLFDDLLQRLIATFRMRTRGYVATPRASGSGAGTMTSSSKGHLQETDMIRKAILAIGLALLGSSFAASAQPMQHRPGGPHMKRQYHRPPPPRMVRHPHRRGHWEMRHGRRIWVR